jgi:hypothetical protein
MRDGQDEYLLATNREIGEAYADGQWRSIRPLGWASLLWIGGFGSFFAVGFGCIGIVGRYNVASDEYPPPGLRLCQAGVALGAVGLVATAVWLLSG